MITKDKVTEIFCIIDEFDKNLSAEYSKNQRLPSHNSDGKRYQNRKSLFDQGIQLVHGLKAKMKNKLMPMWDKIMLRKRYIIECINELLKNKANLVHSRHRSIHNFIMNLCSALTAYSFFENKPEALPVYVEKSRQLELFSY